MSEIKKIILDTDIGIDCDDAAALGLLLNAHSQKQCELIGITAATTREGATSTIKAICNYYEINVPIGTLCGSPLPCDKINNYAKAIKNKYGHADVSLDAVELFRRLLASASEKVSIIAVGPLPNIANLLRSAPDQYSSLNGCELVKEKVSSIYIMGGTFVDNFCEWNLLQDISSARYVSDHCPVEMIYCPHEIGNIVKTRMLDSDNPVWFSMLAFARSVQETIYPSFYRQSWDPVTSMLAIDKYSELFVLSDNGRITIDENGYTKHERNNRFSHRYVTLKTNIQEIELLVNNIIEPQG